MTMPGEQALQIAREALERIRNCHDWNSSSFQCVQHAEVQAGIALAALAEIDAALARKESEHG